LIDSKDIDLCKREKKKKKKTKIDLFNLTTIARLIERLLLIRLSSIANAINLEPINKILFFLDVLPISRRYSRQNKLRC